MAVAAKFPGALATDADLYVAKDGARSALTAAVSTTGQTSLSVADSSKFDVYQPVTCESEVMVITAIPDGATLTVSRGAFGTTAATHASGLNVTGYIYAQMYNQLSAEVKSIEASLGANMANAKQTPWLQDINAGGFKLNNAGGIGVGAAASTNVALYSVGYTDAVYLVNPGGNAATGIKLQNNAFHYLFIRLYGSTYPSLGDQARIAVGGVPLVFGADTSLGDTERMRLTTAGNLGIGTNNPGYLLDVAGDVNITGTYRVNGVPLSTGGGAGAVSSVFTRTGDVVAQAGDYTAAQVTNAVSTLGSYADPSWIASLDWGKIANEPTFLTPTLTQDINAAGFKMYGAGRVIIGSSADVVGALQVTGDSYFTGKLLFSPDNTYDIGASGANRPKNIYMAGTLNIAQGITGGGQFATSASMSATSGYIKTDATGNMLYVNHTVGVTGNYGFDWDKTNELVRVLTAGSARWQWNSAGHLLASTDNAYDIGANGATRPRNVYVGTSLIFPDGSSLTTAPSGSSMTYVYVTTNNYNIPAANYIVVVDGASASSIVLPSPSGNLGKRIIIKRWVNSVVVTVTTAAGSIDNIASAVISKPMDSLEFTTDGSTWFII